MSTDNFFGTFDGPAANSSSAELTDPFAEHEEVDDGVAAFAISDHSHKDAFSRTTSNSPSIHLDAPSLPGDLFSPSLSSQEHEHHEEQSPLSIWQANRRAELDHKHEEEIKQKAEVAEQAKADIEIFLSNRAKTIEKKHQENRTAEKEFRNDLESVMKNGTLWEQVAKLIDLKPKAGKDEQITSRMRGLLLQLKNQKSAPTVRVN